MFHRIKPLRWLAMALLLLGFGLGGTDTTAAQTYPLWQNLQPGPFAPGFRTLERYDYSRTFQAKFDYFGMPQEGERARPIQICIWYPTRAGHSLPTMSYGEYLFPAPDDNRFFTYVSGVQRRDVGRLYGLFQNNQGLVLDALNIEVAAVRSAPAVDGVHPLIVYFPDLNRTCTENFILCEYLASYGFVVITTHSAGIREYNQTDDPADLEAAVRDREFAVAAVRDLAYVDKNKLALMGRGYGALAAMLMQMRNSDVEGIASLSGWNLMPQHSDFVDSHPFLDTRRITVPFLQLYWFGDERFDPDRLQGYKYADRHAIGLAAEGDPAFSSMLAVRNTMVDTLGQVLSAPYEVGCRYVLEFFEAYLKEDKQAMLEVAKLPPDSIMSRDRVKGSFMEGQPLPPTPSQFVEIIRTHGAQQAVEIYNQFRQTDSGAITFPEATMNALGYRAMQRGQADEAMLLFRLNAETYPTSANVWDSYADGCNAAGDLDQVKKCYQKVLEVLPLDSLASEDLKATLRQNAEQGLQRLQGEG